MSQITITGRVIALNVAGTESFKKNIAIVESQNGNYVNYYPVEFHQGDIDTLAQKLQPNITYSFTCWVQGTNKTFVDKQNQTTAYVSLKCTAVAPAQSQMPAGSHINNAAPAPNQGFAQQAPSNGFNNAPQTGYVGAPAQPTQNGFSQPDQNGFGAPVNPGFGQPNNQGGFGSPNSGTFGNPQQ